MNYFSICALVASIGIATHTDTRADTVTPFVTIDRPGWDQTSLSDINATGLIVGASSTINGTRSEGFVLSGNTFTAVTFGAGNSTSAMGISDSGVVVGYYWNASTPDNQSGFIIDGANQATFNIPGAAQTFIRGISPNGRFLSGHYAIVPNSIAVGFVYDRANMSLFEFSSPGGSLFRGVNSLGTAAGNQFGPTVGLIADSITSQVESYSEIQGFAPRLRDISDSGYVIGFGGNSLILGRPGDWTIVGRGAGMTSILGQGLNENLTIVGSWNDPAGFSHGFIATVVPEPSTTMLFFTGIILTTMQLHRKRTSNLRIAA